MWFDVCRTWPPNQWRTTRSKSTWAMARSSRWLTTLLPTACSTTSSTTSIALASHPKRPVPHETLTHTGCHRSCCKVVAAAARARGQTPHARGPAAAVPTALNPALVPGGLPTAPCRPWRRCQTLCSASMPPRQRRAHAWPTACPRCAAALHHPQAPGPAREVAVAAPSPSHAPSRVPRRRPMPWRRRWSARCRRRRRRKQSGGRGTTTSERRCCPRVRTKPCHGASRCARSTGCSESSPSRRGTPPTWIEPAGGARIS